MGLFPSRLENTVNKIIRKKPPRILLLGLDGAGKTCLVNHFKGIDKTDILATSGFNIEHVNLKSKKTVYFWDIGGQKELRPNWHFFYKKCEGIVFVIDSSDKYHIEDARDELIQLLSHPDIEEKPLLILANKQDLDDVMTLNEIIDKMNLGCITKREWRIQATSALSGEGLSDGIMPLLSNIKRYRKKQ